MLFEDKIYKDIKVQLYNVVRVLISTDESIDVNLDGLREFKCQLEDKLKERLEFLSK